MAELITADAVKKIFHLVIPEHALIFNIFFLGKIFYDQNSLIRYFRFFNTEFKKFFIGCIKPMKTN
jgi:hypothetical protein